MRCSECGTRGEFNSMNVFVSEDWIRAVELLEKVRKLERENEEHKAKLTEVNHGA